nr:TagK domain-containing protein [uncultured Ralstonia sp.]
MGDQQFPAAQRSILDDLVPTDGTQGWAPDAGDPFSILRRSGNAAPLPSLPAISDEPEDVLMQLSREADAVLRNPELANAYYQHQVPARSDDAIAGSADVTSADPLQAGAQPATDSLIDMLIGQPRIESLIGDADDATDPQPLFATPSMPDVLQLFAGDIVPPERRGITATLTRREHHLVSMDSAYLPAPAHEQKSEPHDN